jgi:hypothetical protein
MARRLRHRGLHARAPAGAPTTSTAIEAVTGVHEPAAASGRDGEGSGASSVVGLRVAAERGEQARASVEGCGASTRAERRGVFRIRRGRGGIGGEVRRIVSDGELIVDVVADRSGVVGDVRGDSTEAGAGHGGSVGESAPKSGAYRSRGH